MQLDVQRIHGVGDTAIVEFTRQGDVPRRTVWHRAARRRVEVPIVTIIELRDGKIRAEREYFDSGYLMQQLGVVPAPATA